MTVRVCVRWGVGGSTVSNGCKSSAGGEEGGGLTRGRKSALAEDDHALVVRDVLRRVRDVPARASENQNPISS